MSITVLSYYEEHFDMRYCYKMRIIYNTIYTKNLVYNFLHLLYQTFLWTTRRKQSIGFSRKKIFFILYIKEKQLYSNNPKPNRTEPISFFKKFEPNRTEPKKSQTEPNRTDLSFQKARTEPISTRFGSVRFGSKPNRSHLC